MRKTRNAREKIWIATRGWVKKRAPDFGMVGRTVPAEEAWTDQNGPYALTRGSSVGSYFTVTFELEPKI